MVRVRYREWLWIKRVTENWRGETGNFRSIKREVR